MPQENLNWRKSVSLLLNVLVIVLVFNACGENKQLPFYGEKYVPLNSDTVYHTIAPFSFTNQEGNEITNTDYRDQIYIADFFFTSCPGICPVMTRELTRVQGVIKKEALPIKILSHTVDPEQDQIKVLHDYGVKHEADFKLWDFVRGTKKQIYEQALSYLVVAMEDTTQEIPFVHSDKLVLVDAQGRIRGMYSGIEPRDVDQLITDMKLLVTENGN